MHWVVLHRHGKPQQQRGNGHAEPITSWKNRLNRADAALIRGLAPTLYQSVEHIQPLASV